MASEKIMFLGWLQNFKRIFIGLDLWLVGGAARYMLGKGKTYNNVDFVLAPSEVTKLIQVLVAYLRKNNFGDAKNAINPVIRLTGFGGLKIEIDGRQVDFIFSDIGTFLRRVPTGFDGLAVNLRTNAVLRTNESIEKKNQIITTRRISRPKFRPYLDEHYKKQGLLK